MDRTVWKKKSSYSFITRKNVAAINTIVLNTAKAQDIEIQSSAFNLAIAFIDKLADVINLKIFVNNQIVFNERIRYSKYYGDDGNRMYVNSVTLNTNVLYKDRINVVDFRVN